MVLILAQTSATVVGGFSHQVTVPTGGGLVGCHGRPSSTQKRADTVAGGDCGSGREIASGRGGERGEGGGDPRLQCAKLQLLDGPDTCSSRYV